MHCVNCFVLIDEVWKVARYTSAAPMFFHECDNYVDGGVLCNNPTEYGLTVIQNFYRRQGKKFQIALVVSIGSGKYPAEKLGSVNAQDFLSFGKQWLNPPQLMKRTLNLYTLLSNAVSLCVCVCTCVCICVYKLVCDLHTYMLYTDCRVRDGS